MQEDIHQNELNLKYYKEHLLKIETEKKVLELENQKFKQFDDNSKQEIQKLKLIN